MRLTFTFPWRTIFVACVRKRKRSLQRGDKGMFRSRVKRSGLLSAVVITLCAVVLAGQSSAQSDRNQEWEKALAAAKKEGQVNVYIYRYEGLLRDFKRDFPDINVVSVTGRG